MYTGVDLLLRSGFREYEEEKLRFPACCRQDNATYSPHIHQSQFCFLQYYGLLYREAPDLVKIVPAVARLICLVLPGSFLTMFANHFVLLCTYSTRS